MAERKTRQTDDSVEEFLHSVEHKKRQQDSLAMLDLMKEVTGLEPKLWGTIVGFGNYHYKYASGHEGDSFLTGFAPRKQALTLYIMSGFDEYDELMERLGKYKTGKSCLYINKLEDVDHSVLRELIKRSVDHMIETNT